LLRRIKSHETKIPILDIQSPNNSQLSDEPSNATIKITTNMPASGQNTVKVKNTVSTQMKTIRNIY